MDLVLIVIVAFLAAILTFFSGFDLGTLLTPVFLLFFPVDLAIARTGVVHFFNNLFKIILVGKQANKAVLLRFGVPAVIFAFIGAWVLLQIPDSQPLYTYTLFDKIREVTPIKLIIGKLLFVFALMDLVPVIKRVQFGKNKLPIGGALSGFFGGLSGHQGALRSAFLIKAGLSKEAFIGTAVVVSTVVDFTRLSVYASGFASAGLANNTTLILCAIGAAIAGAYLGNKLLKKVTLHFLQVTVAIMLLFISVALGSGLF